jgi:hypothetical protein
MDAADVADDLDELLRAGAPGEMAAREAAGPNALPVGAAQLEELLPVDELSTGDERERATFEDLDVRGDRIVLLVLATVRGEPAANLLRRAEPSDPLAVDEHRVAHQPPAVA